MFSTRLNTTADVALFNSKRHYVWVSNAVLRTFITGEQTM